MQLQFLRQGGDAETVISFTMREAGRRLIALFLLLVVPAALFFFLKRKAQ